VLWERRGLIGVYDENHPDERLPGRYPFLLMLGTAAIGVLRIDIEGNKAIFRRVAVREDMQHAGNGRVLLNLAEKFARANGCDHLYSFVAPDAVGFYEKCGFQRDPENPASRDHVPMEKRTR
jgi:N-acetylglutamate synthase-like GNAT family acetyltransferase